MTPDMVFVAATVVSILLVAMAVAAVSVRSLASAVIFLSSLSLLASVLFLFVAAPDVAITEAAIGSGLTTLVFVLALYRTRTAPEENRDAPMNRADESSLAVRSGAVATAEAGTDAGAAAADDTVAGSGVESDTEKEVSRA